MRILTEQSSTEASKAVSSTGLLRLFEFNQMTLSRLLSDVTDEESLRAVGPDGKCVNWIVGHIVLARGKLVGILGREPDWHKALLVAYGQVGAGTISRDSAKPLSELQVLLSESLDMLKEVLFEKETALNKPCADLPHVSQGGTIADRVGSFACHEAYHAGQIGLMRRLLGKPGLF